MEINWLGAALALVAGMVVAFIWYQKGFIANAWEQLTGVTPERSRPARSRNMAQLLIANCVTAIGLAAGIAIASEATGNDSVGLALLVGLTAWLAFSATTLLQHNAFELKPAKLTAINTGYQLALFLAMSLVIGLL
ncbi:DUF1761 domain-containing protein [Glycomyces algeriensis]|uniref:DUF1761 domain-containing protein n=1 Tax=Glycomyces algeriensis TaxID=256037 RepID=A0A9W6LJ08_9ACTN|nr:DUF1761 domain-containing protein [Glycomyces algeriensis]MDA1368597.1 DUF1761 domain-containing protein [Glycomyces algeriensis]MDR7352396.1 hypothetical protein [Glycomyces algeriensis]GLI45133.1 hypothetical protein GALLR39Z86_49830 [Glycomyces algeriensis]